MINPMTILLVILYGLLVPFVLGLLWTRNSEYSHSLTMSVAIGAFSMLAVFEMFAVPMILTKQPFHLLLGYWKMAIWVAVLVSLVINVKHLPELFRGRLRILQSKSKTEVLIWTAALFVIAFQIYMPVGHMRTDTDDARFVAEAMEAYELDTMLQYHPITGEFLGEPIGEMRKDIASPFPMFMALAGKLLRLPPAVAVHIFFPLLFIFLAYLVYYLLGNYFMHGNSKYTALFLFFLSLIHCFAYESIYAAGYTLLAVIWQGRSVLAMVIMPFIWFLLMQLMSQEHGRLRLYLMLLCAMIAGLMTSSMAIELLPILVGTYSIMIGVKQRKIMPAVLTFLCLIPCAICYMIYR